MHRKAAGVERGEADRIAAVELSIAALHERAEAADLTMQRLLQAIERSCERTVPAPQPVFQDQLCAFGKAA